MARHTIEGANGAYCSPDILGIRGRTALSIGNPGNRRIRTALSRAVSRGATRRPTPATRARRDRRVRHAAAITTLRSRTSCAGRARAAPRSTRSSTIAKTRCTARSQQSLRTLLGRVREAVVAAGPDDDLIAVGITAYVECLTADPAAAAVVLIEGIGVSAEVNALRSRIRRELAEMLRSVWVRYDPEAAEAPHAQAISMGVLGIIIESMEHLVETGRLADAPEHVPALVERGRACLRAARLTPVSIGRARAEARHRHAGVDAAPPRPCRVGGVGDDRGCRDDRAGSRSSRLSPLHVQ